MIAVYSQTDLETAGWSFTSVDNTGSYTVTAARTVTEDDDTETEYTYSKTETLEADALAATIVYASMVEYGLLVEHWKPQDMAFPRSQLYQFIQPATLEQLEAMYEDIVTTSYNNALAYVQSYVGAMFDIETMLDEGGTTNTALTLRLALCISTVTFILASSPQFSDVINHYNDVLSKLLRGLKSGNRNFGADSTIPEKDVRVFSVSLSKTGNKP